MMSESQLRAIITVILFLVCVLMIVLLPVEDTTEVLVSKNHQPNTKVVDKRICGAKLKEL